MADLIRAVETDTQPGTDARSARSAVEMVLACYAAHGRGGLVAMPLADRAAVFLKAAELVSTTWRATLNAATMLGQAKTVVQAEIDAACELADFWRFNPNFGSEIYAEQPLSGPGV